MKLWRKGKTVRVLRKDLRKIVKDEGGAMTEDELMSLVAAKVKADDVELLDEEPKAADDWATEEMPEGKASDPRTVKLEVRDLPDGKAEIYAPSTGETFGTYANAQLAMAAAIQLERGKSKASLNDGTPESSYDGDQLDDSAAANSNTAMINDNDEPPITADEVVNLAKSAGMPAATAWKVLRGMKSKGKANRFKVRVGKRWVRSKMFRVLDAGKGKWGIFDNVSNTYTRTATGEAFYNSEKEAEDALQRAGKEYDSARDQWRTKSTELTDEPDATAMSKDEADRVAEETGGDVLEQQVDQAKGDRAGVGETDDGPDVHVDDPRTGAGEVEGLDEHAPEAINDPRAGPDETAATEPKDLTPGEEQTKDAMQDCISRKVPIFAKENPDWDQSHVLAASYGFCGEKAKAKGVKPATLRKCWPHVLKALTKVKATDPAPEAVAAKAKKLIAEGVGRDEAPALAWKILKSQQTKRVQRSKSMDNEDGPKGLRSLRKWKDMIESDCGGMHKAEQGDVMGVGEKIVKLINNVLENKYADDDPQESGTREGVGETNDGPNENLDNPDLNEGAPGKAAKAKKTFKCSKSLSKSERDLAKNCKDVLEEMSKSGGVASVLRSALAHAAAKLTKAAGLDDADAGEEMSKSLSKDQRNAIEEVLATLKSAAEAQDTPKHLKSALNHEAAQLESLSAAKRKEEIGEEFAEEMPDDLDQIIPNDLDQEHQEMLAKTFNMLESHSDRMKAIDKAMWDKQGRGYAPNGIN